MDNIYEKQDDTTLRVIKPVVTQETESVSYDLETLQNQEISILKSKNDFVEARDKELEEVRELISQAEKLGIKTKAEVALETEQEREIN
jgi:hypothetical protein